MNWRIHNIWGRNWGHSDVVTIYNSMKAVSVSFSKYCIFIKVLKLRNSTLVSTVSWLLTTHTKVRRWRGPRSGSREAGARERSEISWNIMSTRQHSAHWAPVLSSAANCWQTLGCDLLKLIFKSCSISAFDPRTCLVFYWSGVRYCLIICSAYWPHPHYPRNQQRGWGQAVYHENNKQCQHYP